jgi:hypothetical protein
VRAKWVAVGLSLAVAFYLVTLGQRGVALIGTGEPGAVALGVGVLLLPLLVGWAVVRELLFGMHTERLARELAAEGGLPVDDLARTPSGRVDAKAAGAAFAAYRAQTEESPTDWRAWFRLACAYDVARDRRRARAAMRHAISLHG